MSEKNNRSASSAGGGAPLRMQDNSAAKRQEQRQTLIKRYGVKGLTDYEALIPAGRGEIRVSFTGGALTGYGVTPATFSTSDPVIQIMIERSPQFLSGKISLLSTYSPETGDINEV